VGGQCIGRWGVNTAKKKTFEKDVGVYYPLPPAPIVAPPLGVFKTDDVGRGG